MRPEAAIPTVAFIAILDVEDPDGTRTKHPFRHPRITVGRTRGNDLSLEDEAVSSAHCEFREERDFFVVRDLGSANGTFVNGKRVGEARLRNGDEVRIGSTTIRVELKGGAQAPPRVPAQPLRYLVLALLAVAVALAGFKLWRNAADARLRGRFVAAVRDHVRVDPCAAPEAVAAVSAADAAIAGRSVALSLDKGDVKLSREDERTDVELLGLYRKKLEGYAAMLLQLEQRQQAGRESLERIARSGERFSTSRDRTMAAWATGQLRERIAAGDELIAAVQTVAAETRRLCDLIEGVTVRHEASLASGLAHFRFSRDLPTALAACAGVSERTSGSALTALNALDEE